jgi:hypothetical protein
VNPDVPESAGLRVYHEGHDRPAWRRLASGSLRPLVDELAADCDQVARLVLERASTRSHQVGQRVIALAVLNERGAALARVRSHLERDLK